MKRLSGIALIFALGCADTNSELPPIEIGGPSGARLMTGGGRTPEDAYEIAYAQLHKQHINVRRSLEPRGRNLYGAALSMQSILDAFDRMRSLVTPAYQTRFEPWIVRYAAWKKEIERDTWGGSFMNDFEIAERRVKETFHIGNVELVQALPGTAVKEAAPVPAPKPVEPSPAIPPDKVVPPPPRATPPVAEVPAPRPPERAPEATPVPAAGGRIYFKAWDRSHDDLVAAYKATPRPDCRTKYEDVVEALKFLKATLAADRAQKLQIYADYYAGVDVKTKTFTALPDKTSEKDILDELDVVARVIRKEFSPDK